jgi:hypothetical protein
VAPIDLTIFILILKQICLGSLICGFIIFFLTVFLQGSHLFDQDTDISHDFDKSVSLDQGGIDVGEADLDLDIDTDIDIDVDTEVGISLDKDIHMGVDKYIDLHDHGIGADTPTPLMLLLGTFMITFGGSGTFLLESAVHPLIQIIIILGLPIGATFAVSKVWEKIAISETYETAIETIKIDDEVQTLTTIDNKGGLVVIETSSIHGPIKMAAKTNYGAIAKGMIAYVIEIKENTLIIDEWPTTETKKKKLPEGTIKWE